MNRKTYLNSLCTHCIRVGQDCKSVGEVTEVWESVESVFACNNSGIGNIHRRRGGEERNSMRVFSFQSDSAVYRAFILGN